MSRNGFIGVDKVLPLKTIDKDIMILIISLPCRYLVTYVDSVFLTCSITDRSASFRGFIHQHNKQGAEKGNHRFLLQTPSLEDEEPASLAREREIDEEECSVRDVHIKYVDS